MLTVRSVRQLFTPPYFFQPLQIFRRLRLEYLWRSESAVVVRLPWGLPIEINPHEAIGYNIASHGLYEMGVTEALWRLTEPGDLAIDVGANIGYTASILGVRVGPTGSVICFEPHPSVFESLSRNVEIWRSDAGCGSFVLHQTALGKQAGNASLHVNDWFLTNRGTAWISEKVEPSPDTKTIEVPIQSLDSLLDENVTIGIMKIDVQGYELNVLQGMARLLERRAVRDIIFEAEDGFPTPTHEFLKSKGYSIFGLQESFTRVCCLPDARPVFDSVFGQIPNYLATLDADRAKARLTPAVWRSFGVGRLLAMSRVD
jgi:FkbM family methyltransferase